MTCKRNAVLRCMGVTPHEFLSAGGTLSCDFPSLPQPHGERDVTGTFHKITVCNRCCNPMAGCKAVARSYQSEPRGVQSGFEIGPRFSQKCVSNILTKVYQSILFLSILQIGCGSADKSLSPWPGQVAPDVERFKQSQKGRRKGRKGHTSTTLGLRMAWFGYQTSTTWTLKMGIRFSVFPFKLLDASHEVHLHPSLVTQTSLIQILRQRRVCTRGLMQVSLLKQN